MDTGISCPSTYEHCSTLLTQGAPLGVLRATRRRIPARRLAAPKPPRARLAGHTEELAAAAARLCLRLCDPGPTTQLADRLFDRPHKRERDALLSTQTKRHLCTPRTAPSLSSLQILITQQRRQFVNVDLCVGT